MKNIKIQIFAGLIVLCVMLPLQGMFSYSRMPRKNISRSMQSTGKQKIKRQYTQFSPEQSSQGAMGGVKYEDQQFPSLWSKFKSFFTFKTLIPPLITPVQVNALLKPTEVVRQTRKTRNPLLFFNQIDLTKAEQELKDTIDANSYAKTYIIEAIVDNGKLRQLTILDKVLFHILQIAHNKIVVAPQSILNYITLAEFLVSMSAEINAENSDMHIGIFKKLRSLYRKALKQQKLEQEKSGQAITTVDGTIGLLEAALNRLELVLEKVIPEFTVNSRREQEDHQVVAAWYKKYQEKVKQQKHEQFIKEQEELMQANVKKQTKKIEDLKREREAIEWKLQQEQRE